jgi:chitinase
MRRECRAQVIEQQLTLSSKGLVLMNQQHSIFCRIALLTLGFTFIFSSLTMANDSTAKDKSAQASAAQPFFLGYLSGHPDKINYKLFTHICHAFVVADEDGRIVARKSVPSRKLTTEAHQAQVKVILSLGGWGMDKEFAALTEKEDAYERFVTAVMKIIEDYDYDGIDLDWEFPDNPTEAKNFNRLARRFRNDLNALGEKKRRPFLLTMAVNASPSLSKWLDTEVLLETMDFINVMTYDFFGSWSNQAGHHSALFESSKAKGISSQKAMAYWHQGKGIPKEKLLLGLPLYSRGFAAAKPYDKVNRDATRPFQALAYAKLHQLIKGDWQYSWDDETQNPWLISPAGDYVHSYDNEKSLAIKTHWAIEQGYRGVFFWEIKQDRLEDGSNPLLEASHEALTGLKLPPDWFDEVEVEYDTKQPWKDARIEVRRLLSLNKNREAMKLTVLYLQKKDIGDGHEYPMYLYMGGEYTWAIQEYRKRLQSQPQGHTHEYLSLAACYRHFGAYTDALALLDIALQRLPGPPWRIAREADIYDYLGDLFAKMGKTDQASQHYRKAIALYPTSNQPYGRHLLRRRAAKIQSKLDLMMLEAIESGELRDGTYTGKSLGYVGDLGVTVTIRNGKITDLQLQHEEKIDQNATRIIPKHIIEKQSLKVDGITGATVTYDAIIDGTLSALKKAGLK